MLSHQSVLIFQAKDFVQVPFRVTRYASRVT